MILLAANAVRDEIIIYEVMAADVEAGWWKNYRTELERLFDQDCVVIRAQEIQLL